MDRQDRIPKSLKAVTHPAEFEPFRHTRDAADFEEQWQENRPWVMANMAHAAYHPEAKVKELMARFGAGITRYYSQQNAQGFLAVWSKRAVLVFRGTRLDEQRPVPPGVISSIKTFVERILKAELPDQYRMFLANDLLADLKFMREPVGAAEIHRGFLGELRKLWRHLAPDLQTYASAPGVATFATGHSLGGALATIAGMRYKFNQVITFGEPRVGRNIAGEFQAEGHVRYVNGDDPVTMVPPQWWPFSYEHHGERVAVRDPDGSNLIYDHSIVYYAQNLETA